MLDGRSLELYYILQRGILMNKKPVRKKVTLQWLEKQYDKTLRRMENLKKVAGTYLILIERLKQEIANAPKPYVKEG